MRVILETVPPEKIRYLTCGDWQWLEDGTLYVTVPEYTGNMDSAFMVAIHEAVEAWMCRKAGIQEEEVSKFDIDHPELDEPGDSPNAPYHEEHMIATSIERKLCCGLNIDWQKHEDWVSDAVAEVEEKIKNRPQV